MEFICWAFPYKRSYSLTIDLIPANLWLDLMVSVLWAETSWSTHHSAWHTSGAEPIRFLASLFSTSQELGWLQSYDSFQQHGHGLILRKMQAITKFSLFLSLMLYFSNRNCLQTGKSATRARMAKIITLILWQRRVGGIRLPWAIKSVSEPVICSSSTRTRVVPVPGKK